MADPQNVKLARHAADLDDDGHDTTGGGAISVDDGGTPVDPASAITFVGATVADLGGGVAEVTVSGGAGSFDNDADTLAPTYEAGYSFPSGRAYIRQYDWGNAGQDAWIGIGLGKLDIHAIVAGGVDHAQIQLADGDISLIAEDAGDYTSVAFATDQASVNTNLHTLEVYGKGVVFPNLAADPSSPLTGQVYFNTSSNKLRCWDGSAWQNLW